MMSSPRKKVGLPRVLVGVLVVLVVVLVAGNVLIPSFGCDRISSNECAAVGAVRTYLGAQNQFHRTDFYGTGSPVWANPWNGSGFPDLYEVGGPASGGTKLKLIDLALARARLGGKPRAGYYFCEILGAAGKGPYDFSTDCGLCAFPAEYNRTGRNTFIIDVTGVVYQKDTKGWPVWIYPDFAKSKGWIPVGGE